MTKLSLKSYTTRHGLSVGFSVLIAVFLNYYFSFSKEYWMILSAFLVTQTTPGTALKQSLSLSLAILVGLFFSSFLLTYVSQPITYAILATLFVIWGYFIFYNPLIEKTSLYPILFFFLISLVATLEPVQITKFMEARIIDAVLGAAIGILCMLLVSFLQPEQEFRKGILPLLRGLVTYSQALTTSLLHPKSATDKLLKEKIVVENALQTQPGGYPEWVYEVGFNPGLRSGFRFFLITLERVVELFFSMNNLVSRPLDILLNTNEDSKNLANALTNAMKKNQELLSILARYFEYNEIKKTDSDFTSDISELEKALRKVVPHSIELLDISPDYITLTAFVRDIKDIRNLLLQLIMALPAV